MAWQARRGLDRTGWARQGRWRNARHGSARGGETWQVWSGMACRREVRSAMAWQASIGMVWRGPAWMGNAGSVTDFL